MIEPNVGQNKTSKWDSTKAMIKADIGQHKAPLQKLNLSYDWS